MAQCICPAAGCAKCSVDTSNSFTASLSSSISAVVSAAGGIGSLITFSGLIAAGTLHFGTGMVLGAVVGALAVLVVIIVKGVDTCSGGKNDRVNECIGGVVNNVTPSFSSATDQVFPWSASQNEIDVVAKSKYWPIIEKSNAFVWCNTEIMVSPDTDNSEIVRCYFFTPAVCNAVNGSIAGAAVGGAIGVAAVIIIAVVIIGVGCATFYGCLFALLVAAIICAVAALLGAFAGGQIAKDTSPSTSTTTAGDISSIAVGDLITCMGPFLVRGDDSNANVFWWVTSFSLSGTMSGSKPFRYCDVDAQFPMDACG